MRTTAFSLLIVPVLALVADLPRIRTGPCRTAFRSGNAISGRDDESLFP